MTMWNTPIAVTDLWRRVTDREDGTCHCTGQCGRKHSATEGVCDRRLPWDRIVVAPVDATVPPAKAHLVPEAELTTWCEPCLDTARAAVRKAARAVPQGEALFDIPEAS